MEMETVICSINLALFLLHWFNRSCAELNWQPGPAQAANKLVFDSSSPNGLIYMEGKVLYKVVLVLVVSGGVNFHIHATFLRLFQISSRDQMMWESCKEFLNRKPPINIRVRETASTVEWLSATKLQCVVLAPNSLTERLNPRLRYWFVVWLIMQVVSCRRRGGKWVNKNLEPDQKYQGATES